MPMRMLTVPFLALMAICCSAQNTGGTWKHLSTATGDLPVPNHGTEQTSLTVADFGHTGRPGFVVTERTAADSVVLYLPTATGWSRSVIEAQPLHCEQPEVFEVVADWMSAGRAAWALAREA